MALRELNVRDGLCQDVFTQYERLDSRCDFDRMLEWLASPLQASLLTHMHSTAFVWNIRKDTRFQELLAATESRPAPRKGTVAPR